MKYLLEPFRWIYCIYALITFISIMLLIFPFAVLASLLGGIRGGNMMYRLCMLWADVWLFLVFIWIKRIYETPHDKRRSYIFVSNHISYFDGPILAKAFRQPLRALGKVELSKVPVFGFIYKNAIVTVDRGNPENRAKSVRTLKFSISKGISVLVFPEGTFNMTAEPVKEFYDGAFRVAIETQTPVKPVLFLDAYDRLHYRHIFTLTPGKCRIVYLDEIPVEGLTIADVPALREKTHAIMTNKLREYKASWIKTPNA